MDWKFIIGDIVIPIGTFVIGVFVGQWREKKKNSIKISGDKNRVYQDVQKGDKK